MMILLMEWQAMFKQDYDKFESMLGDVAAMFGKTMSTTQTAMYFRALSQYPLEAMQLALDAHVCSSERGRFMPLPADLILQLESIRFDGRPIAEEAWSSAIKSLDENETIVWTEETAEAWYSCANELMLVGDKFNASRGFISKYDELVSIARKQNKPVVWQVAQGYDKDKRDQVIREAYKAKKITQAQAIILLPHHKIDSDQYTAIKSTVTAMIENKSVTAESTTLKRTEELKNAAQIHQERIAALKNAAQIDDKPRYDGAKSKRDTLAIFDDAERLGVFKNEHERKYWLNKAGNGESMRDLQVLMLEKQQLLKVSATT